MTGTDIVTLLFTDLVGSTELFQRLGDDAAEQVRRTHFRLLREAVADRGGHEVKNLGDGLMVVFPSAVDALHSAVAMQEAVHKHNRAGDSPSFSVRVGLHVGEPIRDEGDYFGTPVIVAKRLCDAARGKQILASQLVAGLVGSRGGFRFRPVGQLRLKGLSQAVRAVEVGWEADDGRILSSRRSGPARRSLAARTARGPKLVGRDRELGALEVEFRRSTGGEFRCVLILGEPGVGKTRLAGEVMARHTGTALPLTARAFPLGETTPFGVWSEALEHHLGRLSGEEVAELCGGFLDDLSVLLRSVAAVRGSVPEGEPPRLRVLEGLAAILRNLAERTPVLVLLDDVHLADASSWEALQYLGRHLSQAAVLVLAAARPVELGEQIVSNQVLFALEQDGLLERLSLASLSTDAVAALAESVLGEAPPPALTGWLAERSRGNALFAHGLLRALLEEGADLSAPVLRRLPEGLADRVRTRLAGLDQASVEVLELLATLARRTELDELARLSSRSLQELEDVLARLLRSRLVLEVERGRELAYEIGHPLVQETIYQAIVGPKRRRLHRTIARILLDAGRLGEAAPHFARSSDVGDPEAVEALREAVRQAEERGAYREALTILGALVELLPSGDARWLSVLDALSGQAEWVVDHRADVEAAIGIRALREIDALLQGSPDLIRRATVKSRLASFLGWGTGEVDEAERHAREAVELFDAAGDEERMRLAAVELAYVAGLQGDFPGMAREMRRVFEAADAAGDRFASLQAVGVLGSAEFYIGRFAEAEQALRRAIAIAREDGKLYRLTWSLLVLGWSLGWEGRVEEALAAFEEAKVVNPTWRDSNLLEIEATVHWVAGNFRAAVERVQEALAWNAGGMSRRRGVALPFAALSAAEAGQLMEARRFAAAARAVFGERDWYFCTRCCTHADGVLAWRDGRLPDALSLLDEAASGLLRMGVRPFAAAALVDLAEVAAEAGEIGAAEEAGAQLESIAIEVDRPLYSGLAGIGRACSYLARGTPDRGAELAGRASELLRHTQSRHFLGRSLAVWARALTPVDRGGAVRALEEAAEVFDACGAAWRRGRAVQALHRLRGRGQKAAAALLGPSSLTAREREVAQLAVHGLTAKEIAKQLILGQRTVEGHLANVYAKLGVRSKVELVRRAAEVGLDPVPRGPDA